MHRDYIPAYNLFVSVFDKNLIGNTEKQTSLFMEYIRKYGFKDIENCNYAFDIPRAEAYKVLNGISNYMQTNNAYAYYISIKCFLEEWDIYGECQEQIIIDIKPR